MYHIQHIINAPARSHPVDILEAKVPPPPLPSPTTHLRFTLALAHCLYLVMDAVAMDGDIVCSSGEF